MAESSTALPSTTDHTPEVLNRRGAVRAILFMSLSAVSFSVVELTGAHMVRDIPALQLVWTRYAVHLLFMVIVFGPFYGTGLVRTRHLRLQILRSSTMLLMPLSFLLAASAMPLNNVWAVYWVSPLIALALGRWVLREHVGPQRWVVGVLGFGAMLIIFRVDNSAISPAALPALVMGASISLHLMLSRILRDDHPLTSLFHTALWVFLPLTLVMPFVWVMPSLTSLLGMTVVGLVGALTLYALARSGELAPLPVVASFAYLEALSTMLFSLVLLGTWPGTRVIVGVGIIIAITFYQLLHEIRQHAADLGENPLS